MSTSICNCGDSWLDTIRDESYTDKYISFHSEFLASVGIVL